MPFWLNLRKAVRGETALSDFSYNYYFWWHWAPIMDLSLPLMVVGSPEGLRGRCMTQNKTLTDPGDKIFCAQV